MVHFSGFCPRYLEEIIVVDNVLDAHVKPAVREVRNGPDYFRRRHEQRTHDTRRVELE